MHMLALLCITLQFALSKLKLSKLASSSKELSEAEFMQMTRNCVHFESMAATSQVRYTVAQVQLDVRTR